MELGNILEGKLVGLVTNRICWRRERGAKNDTR